jgi:CheY-like chemotaxis protein
MTTTFQQLLETQGHSNRFQTFQNLMQYRVRNILLVCSLYDSFILEEDGQLYERLFSEHQNLNLVTVPKLSKVSSGREALAILGSSEGHNIDLVITTLNPGDMHARELAEKIRRLEFGIPVVLLTYDERGLNQMAARYDLSMFEKVFLWQGDFRILIAIVKFIEDRRNVALDSESVGVQSIILIEDAVYFYSSYLPIVFSQLFKHSLSLISESVNASERFLRLRARPKILLYSNFEEAWDAFQTYHNTILGVISDINFPCGGVQDPEAGLRFAARVKQLNPDLPVLLQSNNEKMRDRATEVGASFLHKASPTLLKELQFFMKRYFSFGDFVFTLPDGTEVARAENLKTFEKKLLIVPDESIRFHGYRNHFSNWLKARTEFWLAHRLQARDNESYQDIEEMRQYILAGIREWRWERKRGKVVDFNPEFFERGSFARIGQGSLGGKARGLGFVVSLLNRFNLTESFPGVDVFVPEAVVVATDCFDQFLDLNDLRDFALHCEDDSELYKRFSQGRFPDLIYQALVAFVDQANYPLAVRSSSLLEDSRYLPFAGVYDTLMLANNSPDRGRRWTQFLSAIKRVYASTFTNQSKAYFKSTPYRLEEEKMAVIIQKLIGQRHEDRFYPDFSGVMRSYNYYPRHPMKAGDGIASVALGLGESVVAGNQVIQFCPKYPKHSTQFADTADLIRNSQNRFYALALPDESEEAKGMLSLARCELEEAESDGTLHAVASTYDPQNDRFYEGTGRDGPRVVTFAPILKSGIFPLPGILQMISDMGEWSMNSPVEIEFAVNMHKGKKHEFAFLQMRPMVAGHELEELDFTEVSEEEIVIRSGRVLGNALIQDIHDLVFADPASFERSKSHLVAQEFGFFNAELAKDGRPYVAVGLGRWGTADSWLGIPVTWEQVSSVRVFVEVGLKDISVEPSQGSHFFHNLSCFGNGYFTIDGRRANEWIDWDWLRAQKPLKQRQFTTHLRFEKPLVTKMNGQTAEGCICKPEVLRSSED